MPSNFFVSIIGHNEIEGEGLRRILVDASLNVSGVHSSFECDTSCGQDDDPHLFVIHSPSDSTSIEMGRTLRQTFPTAPIVLMGHDCSNAVVAAAFHAGVDGFISKDTSCETFVQMIKLVALGEKVVPSQVVLDLATFSDQFRWSETEARMEEANISDREIEILQGLIHGDPNKVISRRLNITEATVKVHVKSILRKLHVANRTQAAVWALSRGIGSDQRVTEPQTKPQLSVVPGYDRSLSTLAAVAACSKTIGGKTGSFAI